MSFTLSTTFFTSYKFWVFVFSFLSKYLLISIFIYSFTLWYLRVCCLEMEKKTVVEEGKTKTFSQNHIEHKNTANTTRSEINLKAAELMTYICGNREDPTEKGHKSSPSPIPQVEGRITEWGGSRSPGPLNTWSWRSAQRTRAHIAWSPVNW